eukprot:2796530-Ditylum_brightwellii.AAC.1
MNLLLLCIALLSLSWKLLFAGTEICNGKQKISLALYIDDLNINMKNDEEVDRCMALVKRFSDDIGIYLSYNKQTMFITVKGKLVETGILDSFPKVTHEKGYKYLGILESSYFHTKQAKYIATKEQ